MNNFKRLNNITGWVVWIIATFVYLSTIEPTASFWDCGEFIATAYKLEVGHPPGAPMFLMIARFFTMFVSPENAAMMVNALSGLCSSFTILFLFWTITIFGRKIVKKGEEEFTAAKQLAVLGSGVVGALAYTFSDTFWFSAAEGEVYAMSSLITAIVFWAILKWEAVSEERHSVRWIIMIAYLVGLSIGVHLLNLLAIPAITFVYYFKKYKTTPKGIAIAGAVSVFLLGFIQYGIIPGTFSIASKFELLFVNSFGMPFNSGIFFFILLVAGLITWGLIWTRKNQKVTLNTAILCLTVILIGYSSYSMIIIRSSADPPMDENDPEHAFSLLSYLNREQYGQQPLFFGQQFNTPLDPQEPYVDGDPVYEKNHETGKYEIIDDRESSVPNYDSRYTMFFPRMWSPKQNHIQAYKEWSNFKGKPIKVPGRRGGGSKTIRIPTFGDNMSFFFSYQLGHMYWRYFMWNFAGRQNDVQGHGKITEGNWISGIDFIDQMRLGSQDKLPSSITDNEAHNKFYLLPLILGIIGLLFQLNRDKKNWVIVLLLFFFTGLAIVIFLNQYPFQPRERDYAYAGSFYAFAIWIGLGVYAIFDTLRKKINGKTAAIASTVVCLLAVPTIMAKEGWDDHDRSGRYTARDFAKNYLDSCAPNAILFTNGDNDTFPLWYVQEVEEYRTDVRVVNLSLLNTDWYIEQMSRKAYDSDPVPFTLEKNKYQQGTNDYLPVYRKVEGDRYVDVDQIMDFIESDEKQSKVQVGNGRQVDFFPTTKFKIKVDKQKVIENGIVDPEDADKIVDEITWDVGKNKNYLMKNEMMQISLLAGFDWERPVYFAITTGRGSYIGLEEYFQLEGLAYRLVPFKTPEKRGQIAKVDTDIMYENLMEDFQWGGMQNPGVYMDENNRRMTMNLRNNFARLANALIEKGDKEKAKKVLDKCVEVIPKENVPYDYFTLPIAEAYYKIEDNDEANKILLDLMDIYEEDMRYYLSLDREYAQSVNEDMRRTMAILQQVIMLANKNSQEDSKFSEQLNTRAQEINKLLMSSRNQVPMQQQRQPQQPQQR